MYHKIIEKINVFLQTLICCPAVTNITRKYFRPPQWHTDDSSTVTKHIVSLRTPNCIKTIIYWIFIHCVEVSLIVLPQNHLLCFASTQLTAETKGLRMFIHYSWKIGYVAVLESFRYSNFSNILTFRMFCFMIYCIHFYNIALCN